MFEFLKNFFVSKPAEVNGNGHSHGQYPAVDPGAYRESDGGFGESAAPAAIEGPVISIPLQAVVNNLPPELKTRVTAQKIPADAAFAVSANAVLAQLSSGAVKISFGELRRSAPAIFSSQPDRDQNMVALPLHEILARVDPALLTRRQNQRAVQVPEEISSPFGENGNGLGVTVAPQKPAIPSAPRPRTITPAAAPAPVAPSAGVPSVVPPVVPPVRRQAAPTINPPMTEAPIFQPIKPIPFRSSPAPTPAQAAPPAPSAPAPAPVPVTPVFRPVSTPTPAPVPAPIAMPVASQPAPAIVSEPGATLSVAMSAVVPSWPEALRLEVAQVAPANSEIAVPLGMIEEGLKRGKVVFPWKTLRSWIRPNPLPGVSLHDHTMLELPLAIIAPLFIGRQKQSKAQAAKISVDENIPNLFFGFPQAAAANPSQPAEEVFTPTPASASRGMDTNYYVWDDTSESAKVDETEVKRNNAMPGTDFVTRYATPNEVVSRAAALEGVAGALIALPDGLMVASKLSSDLNGDTLAAFLPHIFGKVSQCTKELRMGDLNNLNFTVGNVPWKIFRVNAIYFAAFGYAAQALPTAQLAALAAELDHKKQQ